MLLKFRIYLFPIALMFALPVLLKAQVKAPLDSVNRNRDSLALSQDSLASDTSALHKKSDEEFKSKIDYTAKDSLTYSADHQTAYLYGDAKVNYEDIELTAAYIEYDFTNNQVKALPAKDSTGRLTGLPNFKQGKETFKAKYLTYNFKTKNGVIQDINTEQEGGYLQAQKTKKHADGSIDIKNGIYTTCDAPHPHFGLVLTRGKVLPNDKIISSFAYMEFEDVPLPLFLPFGFFPNSKKSVSGIIMPAYGEEFTRGFYLRDGGYYFALNDHYDLTLTGDIFSKGTWGTRARSTYSKRYKFSGNFDVSYNVNKSGIAGIDSGANMLTKSTDFSVAWTHSQAATANPKQRFSASVNISSLKYDQNNNYYGAQGYQALFTNTKNSNVSFNRSWDRGNISDFANMSLNLRHSQNSNSGDFTLGLPSLAFTLARIYPFRRKDAIGDLKWYENISINYSAQLENTLQAKEGQLFTRNTLRRAQNGFSHSLPFSTNIKFLKYFNFTPSINYKGNFYLSQIRKSTDSVYREVGNYWKHFDRIDTLHRFSYAHGISPSMSIGYNPTIYGMFQFGPKSKINAIRHVITPSVSFNYVPGIKGLTPNYYRTYRDSTGRYNVYSIYDGQVYGTPTPQVTPRSGSFSFSLNNNLEMKIKSAKDTVTGLKKIVIIQSLNFSTGYNPFAPANTHKLSNISVSGNSPVFKGFNINYNGNIDPYNMDSTGLNDNNEYYWKNHFGLGRLTNAGVSFGYTFQSGAGKTGTDVKKPGTDGNREAPPKKKQPEEDFTYFKIPWSFSFNYNFSYSKPYKVKSIIQSLSFNGNFNLTQKWSVNFNSGYDFKAKDFSYTSFSINRNLHCWAMSINFAPFGTYKYYEFRISAISQFLRDLKYEQRKDYRDYPGYAGYGY